MSPKAFLQYTCNSSEMEGLIICTQQQLDPQVSSTKQQQRSRKPPSGLPQPRNKWRGPSTHSTGSSARVSLPVNPADNAAARRNWNAAPSSPMFFCWGRGRGTQKCPIRSLWKLPLAGRSGGEGFSVDLQQVQAATFIFTISLVWRVVLCAGYVQGGGNAEANGKAPANAAEDGLNHSLLAKNNQLRKATLNSRGGRRDHVPASVWKRSGAGISGQ